MKNLLNIILSIILILSFNTNIFANNNINSIEKNINIKKENLSIEGKYPVLNSLKNKSFENVVNEKISEIIKNKTTSYSQSISNKIQVSYEIIQDDYIISILIYFKNLYTNEIIPYSINIDSKNDNFVTINSYLNANGLNYVNKVVSNKTSNMGITYKKVTENTPFYIKNNNVYIIFGAGSITLAQKGNIVLEIPSKNLKNYKIDKNNYYKKSEYNIKMVPLRETLQYFGYTMTWQPNNNSITVLKDNKFISYLVINQNKYSDKNNKIIRQLEFAPELKNGVSYVPISYFSQILEMLFAIDENDNIIISDYIL